MSEKIDQIEAIVGRKVKRDITRMTELMKGNLEKAAASIMDNPDAHVGIVTGFFIQHATPPSPETDGLIGMGHLAAGLASAGVPVTVITDAPCAKAVWAVVDAVPGLLAHRVPVRLVVPEANQRLVADLGRVGSNVNQLAHHLNQSALTTGARANVEAVLAELAALRDALEDALLGISTRSTSITRAAARSRISTGVDFADEFLRGVQI